MTAGSLVSVRVPWTAELVPGAKTHTPSSASATATTTAMITAARRSDISFSTDHHVAHLDGWSGNRSEECRVIADHIDIFQHLPQVSRDGDFLNRISEFPVFNPHPDRASGVIAAHHVDAKTDQLHYI